MVTIYSARWVMPVLSPSIQNGAIAVKDGQIAGVGKLDSIRQAFPDAGVRELGESAIIPGLVNAHTHLELTAMRGYLDDVENNFFAWLKKLTVARMERLTEDDLYDSALWGLCEAARAGITSVGDSSDSALSSMKALRNAGMRGIVFQESFGPDPRLVAENVGKLRDKVSRLKETETPLVRVGVSPHAPYSVCGPQLELIAEFATAENLPLMMHAAESVAEEQLLQEGTGPFAFGLSMRGIDWRAPGVSTIRYLHDRQILETKPLLAHCINVDTADIELLKETNSSVVHCPRSNAKLGHGRAPLEKFLEQNVLVGLGSDSVASNNSCDVLAEARFAILSGRIGRNSAEGRILSADDGLDMATVNGARALKMAGQVGELKEGLQADFAAVSLNGPHQIPSPDPAGTIIFSSERHDVILTAVAGRVIYEDGKLTTIDEERLRVRMLEIAEKLKI